MRVVEVALGDRSYGIHIGHGLLQKPELLLPYMGSSVAIVTNETVEPLYAKALIDILSVHKKTVLISLSDGEQYKTWKGIEQIITELLENHLDRKTTLVALGGGVIGDMTGFAAACYQRGVSFIQVPTTLMAQVDSSVGGKTGINHRLGKNMVGAFHQPSTVVIDLNTLNTLPKREISAGLSEVIKYGCIKSQAFLTWIQTNIPQLMRLDSNALSYAVENACRLKAEVVATDEHESGVRALLNFGHTYGHAIETHMGYGHWLHGEAVSVGMVMATHLSWQMGWLTESDFVLVVKLLKAASLPIKPPTEMTPADFIKHMRVDKKSEAGHIRLVLLKSLGHAVLTSDYDQNLFVESLSTDYATLYDHLGIECRAHD